MNNKTFLLTGCRGFIGGHLSRLIRRLFPHCRIVGVSRQPGTVPAGANEVRCIDLLNRNQTEQLLGEVRPDYIIHLAGVIYSWEWDRHYRGNVETTLHLLEVAHGLNLPTRIVIPGSAAEYGFVPEARLPAEETQLPNPLTPYGVSKSWQTTLARRYAMVGMDVCVGRIFNIIGADMPKTLTIGGYAERLSRMREGAMTPRIEVGPLHYRRDYLDIEDACSALVALARQGRRGEIYNICSGVSVPLSSVLERMIAVTGLAVDVVETATPAGSPEIVDIFGSNQKIEAHTGWRPEIPLDVSIEQLVRSASGR